MGNLGGSKAAPKILPSGGVGNSSSYDSSSSSENS